MSNTIAVIDYGMGNLHSVSKALEHVAPNAQVIVTADAQQIHDADRVVFPGVGAIRDCMGEILRGGFDAAVKDAIDSGKPTLGICVGMQALLNHSEENNGVECLGFLDGEVKFFGNDLHEGGDSSNPRLKVPHMGWNCVEQIQDHPMWAGIESGSRFYFVHSYYCLAKNREQVTARCHYGVDFDVALVQGNLFTAQFHPEKSADNGLQLLKNFSSWQPE
ncbi:MAG: imidazole glycerol phosphate synthase subunit HisH [Cellvibrionaceae bacterium]